MTRRLSRSETKPRVSKRGARTDDTAATAAAASALTSTTGRPVLLKCGVVCLAAAEWSAESPSVPQDGLTVKAVVPNKGAVPFTAVELVQHASKDSSSPGCAGESPTAEPGGAGKRPRAERHRFAAGAKVGVLGRRGVPQRQATPRCSAGPRAAEREQHWAAQDKASRAIMSRNGDAWGQTGGLLRVVEVQLIQARARRGLSNTAGCSATAGANGTAPGLRAWVPPGSNWIMRGVMGVEAPITPCKNAANLRHRGCL